MNKSHFYINTTYTLVQQFKKINKKNVCRKHSVIVGLYVNSNVFVGLFFV